MDPSLTLSAKHLAVDNSGKIWLSCSAYGIDGVFASVDKSGKKLYKEADVKSFDYAGHIYFNGGKLFYMSSADGVNYDVNAFDVTNKEVKKIASGEGFYGIGVDPNNGDVYAANVNGFTTNSSLYVFDKNGNMKIDGELVGVGACRFLFP